MRSSSVGRQEKNSTQAAEEERPDEYSRELVRRGHSRTRVGTDQCDPVVFPETQWQGTGR